MPSLRAGGRKGHVAMEFVVIWVIFGLWAAYVAQQRTGEAIGGFLLGVLLGPIGLLIVYLRKPNPDRVASQTGMKKCPHCVEFIKPEAKVCRYCNRELAA